VTDQEHAGPLRTPPPPLPPLPPPGGGAAYHTYRADLAKVRALVLQQARAAGLAEGRANDLVLAVSEVAANTLRHTQSEGTLTIWRQPGEMICEIRDEGTISDPLAGQRSPGPDATGGHGLWLVYQVCDLVELRSDETGTVIRMHMAIELPDLAADQRQAAEFELVPLRNPDRCLHVVKTRVWTCSPRPLRRAIPTAGRTPWWRSSAKPT
jgi:anti-sigma regulatory factor (Ser/Thr protein kinase)